MRIRLLGYEITVQRRTDRAFCGDDDADNVCEGCGRRFCGDCYQTGQPYHDVVFCHACIESAREGQAEEQRGLAPSMTRAETRALMMSGEYQQMTVAERRRVTNALEQMGPG